MDSKFILLGAEKIIDDNGTIKKYREVIGEAGTLKQAFSLSAGIFGQAVEIAKVVDTNKIKVIEG